MASSGFDFFGHSVRRGLGATTAVNEHIGSDVISKSATLGIPYISHGFVLDRRIAWLLALGDEGIGRALKSRGVLTLGLRIRKITLTTLLNLPLADWAPQLEEGTAKLEAVSSPGC